MPLNPHTVWSWTMTFAALALLAPPILAQDFTPADFCASVNTADGKSMKDIYQTQGLCREYCEGKNFAFAILNYQDCWCSNVAPATSNKVDNGKCNRKCPAYTEYCGGNDVYGYLELGSNPTSTQGGGDTETTTSASQSSSSSTTKSSTESLSTESSSTEEETTSTEESSSVTSATPVISTMTDGGGVIITVTTTPTATVPADTANQSDSDDDGKGPNTAVVAGVAAGVSIAVVAAVAGVFFWLWRKRRDRRDTAAMSENGMRDSTGGILGGGPVSDASDTTGASMVDAGSRSSRLFPVDPRMDIGGYFYNFNESRESVLNANDYSRKLVLRAVNPDEKDDGLDEPSPMPPQESTQRPPNAAAEQETSRHHHLHFPHFHHHRHGPSDSSTLPLTPQER